MSCFEREADDAVIGTVTMVGSDDGSCFIRRLVSTHNILIIMLLCWLKAGAVWHEPMVAMSPGTKDIDSIPARVLSSYVHVRLSSASATSAARWRLEWGRTSATDYAEACVEMPPLTDHSGLYPSDVKVSIRQWRDGEIIWEKEAKAAADSRVFSLKLIYDGVGARLYGGTQDQQLLSQVPTDCIGGRVSIEAKTPVLCQRIDAFSTPLVGSERSRFGSIDELDTYLANSQDPIEGKWRYLDRDIDQSYASFGGKYTLAVVKHPTGRHYDLIYLDGADKERDKWAPLQIKGRLEPTIYNGNYNMWWIDARGQLLDDDNNASLSNNDSLLTLFFPIYKSQLRLSRIQ